MQLPSLSFSLLHPLHPSCIPTIRFKFVLKRSFFVGRRGQLNLCGLLPSVGDGSWGRGFAGGGHLLRVRSLCQGGSWDTFIDCRRWRAFWEAGLRELLKEQGRGGTERVVPLKRFCKRLHKTDCFFSWDFKARRAKWERQMQAGLWQHPYLPPPPSLPGIGPEPPTCSLCRSTGTQVCEEILSLCSNCYL